MIDVLLKEKRKNRRPWIEKERKFSISFKYMKSIPKTPPRKTLIGNYIDKKVETYVDE